jgi:hypothetical protein
MVNEAGESLSEMRRDWLGPITFWTCGASFQASSFPGATQWRARNPYPRAFQTGLGILWSWIPDLRAKARAAKRRLAEPVALEPHHRLIERREKIRAVAWRKRPRPAGDGAGAAQRIHQIARRERHADRVFGEWLAVRRQHDRAFLHAAARQGHVGGDDDVAAAGAFCNPVVGLIHAAADHDALHYLISRDRNRAVADDEDFERRALERMPLGHAIHLLLHRAGIGVDVNGDGF